jgi:hypothetical protein
MKRFLLFCGELYEGMEFIGDFDTIEASEKAIKVAGFGSKYNYSELYDTKDRVVIEYKGVKKVSEESIPEYTPNKMK